jgi:hypothetical protein
MPARLRGAPLTVNEAVVLVFGGRSVPRPLGDLPVVTVGDPTDVDAIVSAIDGAAVDARRVIVLGTHADLAVVLTRLLRTDRLDTEVGFVPPRGSARRARTGLARRVPLIRDETGTVLTRAALWLPPDGTVGTITGEAVVDDATLFDGAVAGVRIEPTADVPGLRAAVLRGRLRPRRWVMGRAAQLGTTGALVVRDGTPAARPVRRSTFYRHTQGWLRVS